MISSSQQLCLLQRALQVPVHLDVAVAQIHAQLVETFHQPGPVGAAQRLHDEGRDRSTPLITLVPATRWADLKPIRFTCLV